MSIQSNSIITTTDINALKNKINSIYNNRPISITDKDRNGTEITKNFSNESFNTVNTNTTINNNFKDMINGLLIINSIPNLLYVNQYDKIFIDGLQNNDEDLLSILNNSSYNWGAAVNNTTSAHPTKENTGCRGACVGFCSGGCSNTTYSNG